MRGAHTGREIALETSHPGALGEPSGPNDFGGRFGLGGSDQRLGDRDHAMVSRPIRARWPRHHSISSAMPSVSAMLASNPMAFRAAVTSARRRGTGLTARVS